MGMKRRVYIYNNHSGLSCTNKPLAYIIPQGQSPCVHLAEGKNLYAVKRAAVLEHLEKCDQEDAFCDICEMRRSD